MESWSRRSPVRVKKFVKTAAPATAVVRDLVLEKGGKTTSPRTSPACWT